MKMCFPLSDAGNYQLNLHHPIIMNLNQNSIEVLIQIMFITLTHPGAYSGLSDRGGDKII